MGKSTALILFFVVPLLHESTGGGAMSGFLHPLLGLTHLLAMVTVGLLSAQLGGKAIWTVPSVFVSVMVVGGLLGLFGGALSWIELGLAVSVVVLGLALAAKQNLPVGLVMAFVGLFAVFHGYAHGIALPDENETILYIISYVIGFVISTVGLHVIGALLGAIAVRTERGDNTLRIAGGLIAVVGAGLVFGFF